jgi:hypothetical protein
MGSVAEPSSWGGSGGDEEANRFFFSHPGESANHGPSFGA